MISADRFELKHLILVLEHVDYERLTETLATMSGSFDSDLLLILTCPESAVCYSNGAILVVCRPESMKDEIAESPNVSYSSFARATTSVNILRRREFVQSLIDFFQNSDLSYNLNVMYVIGKQTYIIQIGDMDASDLYSIQTNLTFNMKTG